MLGKRDFEKAQVKNKAPAARQITAEQILREAVDSFAESIPASKQTFADETELNAYKMTKRKEFEDTLRRQRQHIGTWIKYAKWEEGQGEYRRARSIFERALHIDYQNVSLWLKYIEMEISHKFIQHARTLYDRVTGLLPRVDQFWFKYAYMEERLENYAGSRAIFEKWMEWKPTENAWMQYAKFEERCGEIARARSVYERFIQQDQSVTSFLRYCKFEERCKDFDKARAGFETCVQLLDDDQLTEEIFIKYAQFEIRRGQYEKANRVFKIGLSKLADPLKSKQLYSAFVQHTKQTGTRDEIEQILVDKRRAHYERLFVEEPTNLDACFDYIRMEEEAGDIDRVREVFERSVAKIPMVKEKKYFRRYIYLWLFYAQFEESVVKDVARARSIYTAGIELMGSLGIWFGKVVKSAAEFELRQLNLEGYRKICMNALVKSDGAKSNIPRFWIETELKLGNVSQARTIAAKLVEITPGSASSWVSFIDLELALGEISRATALCHMGWKNRDAIDHPYAVLEKEIEIEKSLDNLDRVRILFKTWISESGDANAFLKFSDFEADEAGSLDRACAILEEALEIIPDANKRSRTAIKDKLDELIERRESAVVGNDE